MTPLMDIVDRAIIQILQQNSRLSMRKLAVLVHMSPPAVAERIRRLEDLGIIIGYTIRVDEQKLQPMTLAYIDIMMNSNDHRGFLRFVNERKEVRECHRLAGRACYLLKVEVANQNILNSFLEKVLLYANYRLSLVIASTVKDDLSYLSPR